MTGDVPTDAWPRGEAQQEHEHEHQQVKRFRTILRVIAQRAHVAGVTLEEYFAGIIAGTYPKVEQIEIDAVTHDN